MKIVKIERNGETAAGILEGDQVAVLGAWQPVPADEAPFAVARRSFEDLASQAASASERVPLSDVRLAVPFNPLSKIICVGMNYRNHTAEIKVDIPENPVIFTRSLDSIVAADRPIVRPSVSETFDFEGEIAVVIGKPGRHIARDRAFDHVFGYTCFLDGSVRQYQRQSLTAGKNFSRSGGMGPWIVTSDEIGDADLSLSTRLNGEQVQAAMASDMIFGIADIIEYCSRWTELRPGDVIATGTPGGVGSRREPPLWMKPGDRIEVEIGGVGLLRHGVVAEEEEVKS